MSTVVESVSAGDMKIEGSGRKNEFHDSVTQAESLGLSAYSLFNPSRQDSKIFRGGR